MKLKPSLFAVIAALAISTGAHAQEGWYGDGGDDRHAYWEQLRAACDYGDDRACWQLRQMRQQWRAQQYGGGGWQGGPGYGAAPPVNNKAALCAAIRNNFNNCVAQQQSAPWQHINCNAWPLQLQANRCL